MNFNVCQENTPVNKEVKHLKNKMKICSKIKEGSC
jgi:hypothetical protein